MLWRSARAESRANRREALRAVESEKAAQINAQRAQSALRQAAENASADELAEAEHRKRADTIAAQLVEKVGDAAAAGAGLDVDPDDLDAVEDALRRR